MPILSALVVSACGASGSSALPNPAQRTPAAKIAHVVVIIQENRSFNDLFYGFPGAHTVTHGYDSHGRKIALSPIGLDTTWDLDHSSYSFFTDCNGAGRFPGTACRMNGFDREYVGCGHTLYPPCPVAHPAYGYVPRTQTRPYFEMAHRYVLADRMFASNFDASSFVSHQYIIAGQANSAVNFPDGSWGCEGGKGDLIGTVSQSRTLYGSYLRVCFDSNTLGDELDQAALPWAFYAAAYSSGYINLWSAYQAIGHIYYGPDWKKDVLPNT